MKRLWIIVIVLVVIGGGVALAASMRSGGQETETPVRVATVERGDLTEFVTAPGQIQAKTKVSISAKVSSQIVELPFDKGDRVKRGDLLVRLDDTEMRARLRAAEARRQAQAASLGVAEAQLTAARARLASNQVLLDQAQRDLDRQLALYETRDISKTAVDDAQARFDQLSAQVRSEALGLEAEEANQRVLAFQIEAADADIEQARDALQYTLITSPIDGVITKLNAQVGEIVMTGTMNNAGTVIMEVADLSEMIVEAEVDETDVPRVEVGQAARIRAVAYGDTVLNGTVRSVSLAQQRATGSGGMGSSNTEARNYICEVLLDSEDTARIRVFTGLTADVEIQTRYNEGVVRVPSQSVVGRRVDELPAEVRQLPEVRSDKEFTTVVYRMVDGVATATPVEVGPSDLRMTVITSGLSEGQQIITGPYKVLETVRHGQKVRSDVETTPTSGETAGV